MRDTVVESIINQFKERSEVGIKKYGTTLDRNDLNSLDWIEHTKQELMDAILYLEKLSQTLKNTPKEYTQTQNQPYFALLGKHNQIY